MFIKDTIVRTWNSNETQSKRTSTLNTFVLQKQPTVFSSLKCVSPLFPLIVCPYTR